MVAALSRLLLVLSILAGLWSVVVVLTSGVQGWDADVYCRSVRAVAAGLDPYDTVASAPLARTLPPIGGDVLTFSYPRAVLLVLGPLCARPAVLYPLAFTAALVLASWLWRPLIGREWLLWSALVTAGLAALAWNYLTGNTGVLELLALVPMLLAVSSGRAGWAGVWIGLVSAVKLLPLIFAALFCVVMAGQGRHRVITSFVRGVAASFLAVHALSMLMSPDHYRSYLRAVAGTIPGQHAAIGETAAGWANPALLLLVKDALGRAGLSWPLVVAADGIVLAAGLVAFVVLWRRLADPLALWSYGALIACLVLPRIKPYTYTYAIPALFVLLRDRPALVRGAVVAIAALLPTLVFLEHWRLFAAGRLPDALAQCIQPLALLAALVVLLVTERYQAAKRLDTGAVGRPE